MGGVETFEELSERLEIVTLAPPEVKWDEVPEKDRRIVPDSTHACISCEDLYALDLKHRPIRTPEIKNHEFNEQKKNDDASKHVGCSLYHLLLFTILLYHQLTSYHYSNAEYAVGRVYNTNMLLVAT